MRAALLLGISAFLAPLLWVAPVQAQTTTPLLFTETLTLGSSGTEVTALQQLLNRDADTRIASAGLGSPGKENGYFGALTRAAVIRFQNKYASTVLAPSGLRRGNGRVGPFTRAQINSLLAPAPTLATSTPIAIPPASTSLSIAAQNPNLIHMNEVFAAITKSGKRQGMSATTTDAINQALYADAVATTTDIRQTFLNLARQKAKQAQADLSPTKSLLASLTDTVIRIFRSEVAHAQSASGSRPFGGKLYFTWPCTCSSNGDWFIVISPLPPDDIVILETAISAGAYANYSIPFTPALLGHYSSQANGCEIYVGVYCIPIPAEGQVTSETGSA